LIPGFQSVCDQIAQYGITYIIQYIQQNEDPQQICQQIGLCSSQKKIEKQQQKLLKVVPKKSSR